MLDAISAMPTSKPVTRQRPQPRTLSLALQGGGSFGAFTWGVLDRLLEEPDLDFDVASGASAGAINATLLAAGLLEGRKAAREKLRRFWRGVSKAGDYMRFARLSAGSSMDLIRQTMSPYQFNPLDLNPLRDALLTEVDFARLASASPVRLLIATTRVSDGQPRIFATDAISADVVLASACLPLLQQAVMIEGEAYWDGGYAANPPLLALAQETRSRDILVVQLTPARNEELPKTRKDILRRLDRINLNATLNAELEALRMGAQTGAISQLRDLRVHRIAAEDSFDALVHKSAGDTQWRFLQELHDAGRNAAGDWLASRPLD